jgi:hypothetical protein
MAGVDLKTVQELMGHKTISMTARYARLAPTRSCRRWNPGPPGFDFDSTGRKMATGAPKEWHKSAKRDMIQAVKNK